MGRMLDALKQADTQRRVPRLAQVPANGSANENDLVSETAALEIPFIEWGPRKSMEASPSVLASPGPASRIVNLRKFEPLVWTRQDAR